MEFLKEILGEELYAQVAAKLEGNKDVKLANLASGEYVSKAKYESDMQAKETRIQELTQSVKGFDGVDVKQLQKDVNDWKTKYDHDLEETKRDSAIRLAIAKSGTLSEKALMGLLDKDKIKFDKDGKLTGLDEQIEAINKEDSFLFKAAEPEKPNKGEDVKLGGDHGESPKPEAPTTLAAAISEHYKK